ncbi:MAG TPA: hypothetical protein ENH59_01545 [Bacteroidetes bacterium]|nr:hypothetical protein [Bacteroidota bacterium]
MTFDNGKTIIRLRLRLFIVTIIMLVYVYLVYYGKQLRFPILGIREFHATLILTALYLLLAFLPLLLKYRYIYFSDDGKNIIFRYYSVGFLSGKKSSVEIPKHEFAGYKIKKSFMGLLKAILLYRMIGTKKASYSPVYVSSLSKSELKKINKALDRYTGQ